tara:strand:+ start:4259 stop:4489 length:231 start_codon:yes stop_codon:yes gene_type:complete
MMMLKYISTHVVVVVVVKKSIYIYIQIFTLCEKKSYRKEFFKNALMMMMCWVVVLCDIYDVCETVSEREREKRERE